MRTWAARAMPAATQRRTQDAEDTMTLRRCSQERREVSGGNVCLARIMAPDTSDHEGAGRRGMVQDL
jgi:hypothetical protein